MGISPNSYYSLQLSPYFHESKSVKGCLFRMTDVIFFHCSVKPYHPMLHKILELQAMICVNVWIVLNNILVLPSQLVNLVFMVFQQLQLVFQRYQFPIISIPETLLFRGRHLMIFQKNVSAFNILVLKQRIYVI